jgi:hypothetical protein
MFWHGSSSRWF